MRRRAIALILMLVFCAIRAPAPARADAGEEATVLSLLNGLRVSRGLQPLAVHGELRALANDWAQHMAAAQTLSHSPLNSLVTAAWLHLGENVGVDVTVAGAERALEASPTHLANLLSPAYNYIGIGVAHGADGGVYVVQDFMQLAGGAPKVAPARAAPRPTTPRPSVPRRPAAAAPVRPAAPPALPPPPPPAPSPRLADVFGRLQALDEQPGGRLPGYGFVRMNW